MVISTNYIWGSDHGRFFLEKEPKFSRVCPVSHYIIRESEKCINNIVIVFLENTPG